MQIVAFILMLSYSLPLFYHHQCLTSKSIYIGKCEENKSCANPKIASKCAGIIFHYITICISMLSVVLTQFERFTQMFHHIVEAKHSSKT